MFADCWLVRLKPTSCVQLHLQCKHLWLPLLWILKEGKLPSDSKECDKESSCKWKRDSVGQLAEDEQEMPNFTQFQKKIYSVPWVCGSTQSDRQVNRCSRHWKGKDDSDVEVELKAVYLWSFANVLSYNATQFCESTKLLQGSTAADAMD